jgi:hypothetical protein
VSSGVVNLVMMIMGWRRMDGGRVIRLRLTPLHPLTHCRAIPSIISSIVEPRAVFYAAAESVTVDKQQHWGYRQGTLLRLVPKSKMNF